MRESLGDEKRRSIFVAGAVNIETRETRNGTSMSGGRLVLDLAHKAGVISLLAGTAYGTYVVSSAVVELRRAGQAAVKKEPDSGRAKAP